MLIYSLHSRQDINKYWVASSIGDLVSLLVRDIEKAKLRIQSFEDKKDKTFVRHQEGVVLHAKGLIKALTVDRPQGFTPGYLYQLTDGSRLMDATLNIVDVR